MDSPTLKRCTEVMVRDLVRDAYIDRRIRRSIYETPDGGGPAGGNSCGQLKSDEGDGTCPALMDTLTFGFQIHPIAQNNPIER